ncbi:response regulator [Frigidibacter sp. MR17.14]|uniref:response regulator transcription factor n=1 Tax=Frigidibacter sp. MR17.14 TaxID=3126509 RepID=UPI003012C5FE
MTPLGARRADPARPFLGLTVLAVEDSRFASEALRLLCLRSGARIRRAESIAAAQRHLAGYRPDIAVIDLGLPDGSGCTLIRSLAAARPRVPAILAISGRDEARDEALAAGADAFLPKPIPSLAAFQAAVLGALPADLRMTEIAAPVETALAPPDPMALRDDLAHAAEILTGDAPAEAEIDYVAGFLAGIARLTEDPALAEAAAALLRHRARVPGAPGPGQGAPAAPADPAAAPPETPPGAAGRDATDEAGRAPGLARVHRLLAERMAANPLL